MLSDKQVKEFQKLWKERFGIEITKKEATSKGMALVCLMQNIYKPITHKDLKRFST